MQSQVIHVNESDRLSAWYGSDRAVSISNCASIKETFQALLSRMVLSEDFPHDNGYPLAVLSVLVSKYKIYYKKSCIFVKNKFRLIIKIVLLKWKENLGLQ